METEFVSARVIFVRETGLAIDLLMMLSKDTVYTVPFNARVGAGLGIVT